MADLEQVVASLKADEARVAAAQARLDDTVIRASFSGRTGFRHVSVGSFVSPGTVITTLDDTSIIKLDFTVPETYLFVLRRGLPVTAAATGLPDRTFDGVVTNMDSRVDPVTRSVIVRAELANPDGLLRQGMFMTVSLQGEVTPTLLVPEEALVPERGHAYVFVVKDNVVERREVQHRQAPPRLRRDRRRRRASTSASSSTARRTCATAASCKKRRPAARADACGSRSSPSGGRSSRPSSACCS